MTTVRPTRHCARCGHRLAADNPLTMCSPCQSATVDAHARPPLVPPDFWQLDQMRDALATWHMGRVIFAYRNHPYHRQTLAQGLVGSWLGLTQAQLSRIENGRAPEELSKLIRYSQILAIPADLLWFDLPGQPRTRTSAGTSPPILMPVMLEGREIMLPVDADAAKATGLATMVTRLAARAGDPGPRSGAVPLAELDRPGVPAPVVAGAVELPSETWAPEDSGTLADALAAEDVSVITAASATRLAHEWLLTPPPQIVETASGRRVGRSLVQKIEGRIRHLRRLDDFLGGNDLHEVVRAEMVATAAVLRGATYSEDDGRRLLVAVGELCQLAGWVASDAGLRAEAERYYVGGVRAAHAAGDKPLAANLISTLSYQVANAGDADNAVLLARTAREGARHTATPTTLALLGERLAWAQARAGDRHGCERTLAEVERDYGRRRPADDPEWVYWLDEDEIAIMAGRCFTQLGDADHAEPLLRAAIDRYDVSHAREVALYSTWLAEVQLQRGELDEAAALATDALRSGSAVGSERVLDRVGTLTRVLVAHADTEKIRGLSELYASFRAA